MTTENLVEERFTFELGGKPYCHKTAAGEGTVISLTRDVARRFMEYARRFRDLELRMTTAGELKPAESGKENRLFLLTLSDGGELEMRLLTPRDSDALGLQLVKAF